MKRYRNKKKFKITLAVLLLVISIGYALLNANLTINGTSNFARTTWNIHFENLQDNTNMTLGQNDSAAAITQNKTNEVTYVVSFNEPGQFYEFTVDAKNDGTIDGMVNAVTSTIKIGNGEATPITTNPSNLPAYMSYTATYSDGTPIEQYHLLASNTKETYKVRVEFRTDIEATDLPGTDQTIELTFGVEYVQKDSNGTPVVHPVNGTRYSLDLNNGIQLNQVMPAQVTFYDTAAEARAQLSDIPFYLKHTIVNDVVTESYLEFVVTDDMVTNNEGMIAGTYTLIGGGGTNCVFKSNGWNCDSNSPYYETNINTLKTAFGYSTHPERCSSYQASNSLRFYCGISELQAFSENVGEVTAYVDSSVTIDCSISANGISSRCGVG